MIRLLNTIILFLFILSSSAQKIKVDTQVVLSKSLHESSGLIYGTNNSVWTHNDSGGKPILYKLDIEGKIIRQVYIRTVKNIDWEDLANDYKGFAYIADIGNNCNCRRNLKILKIPHPDSLKGDSIVPETISFSYENQTNFPPKKNRLNFDAEALIAYEDSLFIFTKNWTNPYSKYTYVYALPNKRGVYVAVLRDSIFLEGTHKYHSWITSATRHPKQDILVLLSHKKAWIIKGFRNKKKYELIQMKVSGIYSQKEAVCFGLNDSLWISNEKFLFLRAKLKKGAIE